MRILITNGRIVDPASGRDKVGPLLIDGERIVALDAEAEARSRADRASRVIDAKGLVVAPGLIDLSARLREPGFEYKATLESEMDAAVAGGITSIACPPDTDPPLDEPGLVDMLRRRAKAQARARVYPVGALTVKLKGEALTEMVELAESGCVAFSQANEPLADTQVLWRALQYAATFGLPVWLRAENAHLARGGVAHDGEVATRLGLPGIPAFAETIALGMLLELVRATGARLHVCRISTAGAVEMLRRAKAEKLPVSCDVGVHHVHLSEMDLGFFDPHCRLIPPLRSARDRDALRAGLADGSIDCVCSDHTPLDDDAKQAPFGEAEPGATGLELLLPLVLRWADEEKLPLAQALARVTCDPARVLGIDKGRIAVGASADLVVFDPSASARISVEGLKSQGKNSPFLGYELPGQVRWTLVAGNPVYESPGAVKRSRFLAVVVTAALAALVSGCGLMSPRGVPEPPGPPEPGTQQTPAPRAGKAPVETSGTTRGGAYYKDDGPGADIPPNLAAIPDAVPRPEPLHRFANRPYEVFGKSYVPMARAETFRQRGMGSWYGRRYHGSNTSSGERYDMYAMTAAHPTLPIPSYARVTNLANGKSVVVRINDRGPFHSERIVDLSYTAAWKLGYVESGSVLVQVDAILPEGRAASPPSAPPVREEATQPAAASAATPTPMSEKGIFLQLGAFGSQPNAEGFRARVARDLAWLAGAMQIRLADGLYKLQIGPYRSQDEARVVAERIRGELNVAPVVVLR